ncbi:MAG: hypothetical protein CBB97_02680 [Candidatus Endolissoclinum sp. TMED37]|nr:MAG: hypothetical protein CBB97_02680 [Candidatus Endolissoclinum sp. TMED37]
MKKYNFFFVTIMIIFLSSCSSKKQIVYMQDIDSKISYKSNYKVYKVKVDDILKIDVNSDNPETALAFNPLALSNNISSTKESLIFNGYIVNSDGNIYFPSIGEINVIGKTINQIRNSIYKLITENDYLINPTVDVKLLNSYFTILGEVNNPGRYEYVKNNINILEAIGIAGDLTINGKRVDIKVLRDDGNKKSISSIDLTKSSFLENDNFQIFSGDIIIVNPNSTRIKNAGIIGNSGTLLSLLSFILSSIIVISNR